MVKKNLTNWNGRGNRYRKTIKYVTSVITQLDEKKKKKLMRLFAAALVPNKRWQNGGVKIKVV